MTHTQKQIITALLLGGSIANMGAGGIRLRDKDLNPVLRINPRTFWFIRNVVKRNKKHVWVISLADVRKLHGKSWIKKEYTRLRAKK